MCFMLVITAKTATETLTNSMEPQGNYFVANHQPACDSHSAWKESSVSESQHDKIGSTSNTVVYNSHLNCITKTYILSVQYSALYLRCNTCVHKWIDVCFILKCKTERVYSTCNSGWESYKTLHRSNPSTGDHCHWVSVIHPYQRDHQSSLTNEKRKCEGIQRIMFYHEHTSAL